MLLLRDVVKIKGFGDFKCKYLRLSSTNAKHLKVNNEVPLRKYLKPLSNQTLKPSTGNFVCNLFQQIIDKRVFEYPSVLQEDDVDLVSNHSFKVEDFFSSSAKSLLTENVLQKLKELELFGLTVPQKYGGAGYTETELTFLIECTGINPTFGRFISYNENYGCKLLNLYGTEEQKEKYLPRLSEGKSFITLACVENGSLVDVSNLEGFAIPDNENNQYILKGEKKWVHNADKADLFLVMLKLQQPIDDYEIRVKFNMFIVEKNTPGVTVHKVVHPKVQEANLFEVSFNDVCIPKKNVLGNIETNGFIAFKTGLSHTNISDSALCLNLMKQILHSVIQFIHEKNLSDASVSGFDLIQDNLASLVIQTYGLESVIYFLTGRFDSYENFDLFSESVLTKVIALEILQSGIQKYIEILGRYSFSKSGVLDEAIQALQYYSVFVENIEILKMVIGTDGLVTAAPKLSQLITTFRRPYDHHNEFFKKIFAMQKETLFGKKLKHNFKMELHSSLSTAADGIEMSCNHIEDGIRKLFIESGTLAMEKEHVIIKIVEKTAYLYAAIACLSRASLSICYDLENHENEKIIAQAFAQLASSKIEQLFSEEVKYVKLSEYYRFIGKNTFNNKSYPAEHPLTRTF